MDFDREIVMGVQINSAAPAWLSEVMIYPVFAYADYNCQGKVSPKARLLDGKELPQELANGLVKKPLADDVANIRRLYWLAAETC